jgi:hypothetical protein
VSQLLVWAGWPLKTAKLSAGIVIRYNEKGEREELPVDFGQILKGKKEDFVVRMNDIVFLPGSKIKTFQNSLLASLPGTIATLPYRIP